MDKIASFQINHDTLTPGLYISRIDGDIVSYDLRCVCPNRPPFLDNAVMHTMEHLFATYVRNSDEKEHIVYFGPMGCRTGFYFLTRSLSHERAIALTKEALAFIAAYDGEIPGTKPAECGNYLEHDLAGAKACAGRMVSTLVGWNESLLAYEAHNL